MRRGQTGRPTAPFQVQGDNTGKYYPNNPQFNLIYVQTSKDSSGNIITKSYYRDGTVVTRDIEDNIVATTMSAQSPPYGSYNGGTPPNTNVNAPNTRDVARATG